MDKYLGKQYKLKYNGTFEEYMKFIDIGMISRKTAMAVTPVACVTKNDDGTYTLTMSTSFKSTKVIFTPGEEFIEERADGVKVKSTIVFDGDHMIQTQVEDNGRTSKHIRKFSPTGLIVITTAEGWDGECVRTYELIE